MQLNVVGQCIIYAEIKVIRYFSLNSAIFSTERQLSHLKLLLQKL